MGPAHSTNYLDLYVRTAGDPSAMVVPVRSAIAAVDGGVALFDVRSQQDQILAGLLVGIALGRSVAALLHGVSPLDPLSLAGAAAAMALLATVAVLVPALRAARLDPLQVIREP